MDDDRFLPDAATVAAIEKDVETYNQRRRQAKADVSRRMPVFMASFAVACAFLLFIVYVYRETMPGSIIHLLLMALLVAGAFCGAVVYSCARKPGKDTQQEFRNHIMPVLFGFVRNLRYSSGYPPNSFTRLPAPMKGNFNQKTFGDIITGRLGSGAFEIYELELARRSKSSNVIVFKGLVLSCDAAEPFAGTLVAVRRPPSGFGQAIEALMRPLTDLFSQERLVPVLSRSRLDRTYEFRTDTAVAAGQLLSGRFTEVLQWVDRKWRKGSPQLAIRRSELFLMLPTEKDFFELPPLERPATYEWDLKPMIAEFAALLAIVEEVQRPSAVPLEATETAAPSRAEESNDASQAPVVDEGFVPLLDDVPEAAPNTEGRN